MASTTSFPVIANKTENVGSELVATVHILFVVITIIWIPFIILGNSLIIASTFIYKKLRSSRNYFLASLAVADLSLGCLCIPMYATAYLAKELIKDRGPHVCFLWVASIQISAGTSLHSLLLITLDRWLAVCKPHCYNRIMSKCRAKIYIAIIWVYNIVEAFLPLFGYNRYNPNEINIDKKCNYYLSNHRSYVVWASFVHIGFSIGVSAILNFHIFYIVKKMQKRLKHENTVEAAFQADSVTTYHISQKDPETVYKRNVKTVKFSCIIFSLYILFWIPYLMTAQLKYIAHFNEDEVEVYKVISQLSNFFNAVISAPLYAYMRLEYRVAYRQLLATNPCHWRQKYMANHKLEELVRVPNADYSTSLYESMDDGHMSEEVAEVRSRKASAMQSRRTTLQSRRTTLKIHRSSEV